MMYIKEADLRVDHTKIVAYHPKGNNEIVIRLARRDRITVNCQDRETFLKVLAELDGCFNV